MTALDVLNNIQSNANLKNADFRFCLVSSNKHPHKIDGTNAKPNNVNDFVDLDTISKCSNLDKYAGLGVSIQASNIIAIDVDKCFSRPFDITSADTRALDIMTMFIDDAYIEFSFSGTGLRLFYRQPEIEDYSTTYYTKAETYGIEYYQPSCSARYVTITGKTIINNQINTKKSFHDTIMLFINKYMKRKLVNHSDNILISNETLDINELLKNIKILCRQNIFFQNRWFDDEHKLVANQSHESQNDYQLMSLLYEHITKDKNMLRQLFELSPYFKTKDNKHLYKWTNNNYRYFNYVYEQIKRLKGD